MQSFSSRRPRLRTGSSLIEVLVVLVIITVGVLSAIQVFPTGLGVLRTTANNSIATQLARTEMQRLKGTSAQLPDAIVAANDAFLSGGQSQNVDLITPESSFYPADTVGVDQTGALISSSFGGPDWKLRTGANRYRTIFGEGRIVPAPRFVGTGAGTMYGSLMTLQFAPVSVGANPDNALLVYGNDLVKRPADGGLPDGVPFTDYVYFVDNTNLVLYLPQGRFTDRDYRVSTSFYVTQGTNLVRRAAVFRVTVPNAGGGNPTYAAFTLSTNLGSVSELDFDSFKVQRLFRKVATFTATGAAPRSDTSYEYMALNVNLGQLLFNPDGYAYQERRGRGRFPLQARVDYNVLDWRVLHDDFRVPTSAPYIQKLLLGGQKVFGRGDIDGSQYSGFPIGIAGARRPQVGGFTNGDFVLVDTDSGGVIMPDSYEVDMSSGTVRFLNITNTGQIQANVIFPTSATPGLVNDIRGHSVRALYQCRNEWAVQPVKGATTYQVVYGLPLSNYDQCFPGFADGATGNPAYLYFPLADTGRTIMVGELVYNNGGAPIILHDQELIVQAPKAGDPVQGAAHVDIRDLTGNAASVLDYTYGYSVRRIRGVTIGVKVWWNPDSFRLFADATANLAELDKWQRSQRHVSSESFLVKGSDDE